MLETSYVPRAVEMPADPAGKWILGTPHWKPGDRLQELAAQASAIKERAEAEHRDFTAEEARQLDEIFAEFELCNQSCERADKIESLSASTQSRGRRTTPDGPHEPRHRGAGLGGGTLGVIIGQTKDGRDIRALRPHERLCDMYEGPGLPEGVRPHDLSLGKWIQGMVTHRWEHAPMEEACQIRAAQSGSSDPAGGFIVPGPIALPFIDLARSRARVIEAGSLVVNLNAPTGFYGKITGDVGLTWRPQGAVIPASDLTFGRINVQPKTVAGRVLASVEWLEDVANGATLIEQALASKLANEIDRVALYGTGAQEPAGLKSAAWSPQTITSVGTPADYDDLSTAAQKILTANGPDPERMAALLHPRDWGTYDRLRTADDLPFAKPASVAAMRMLPTTQVSITEGAGAEASMFVGDWSQLVILVRTDVVVEVSRQAGGDNDEGWNSLQVSIRAYLRADIGVLRDDHFVILSGVTVAG